MIPRRRQMATTNCLNSSEIAEADLRKAPVILDTIDTITKRNVHGTYACTVAIVGSLHVMFYYLKQTQVLAKTSRISAIMPLSFGSDFEALLSVCVATLNSCVFDGPRADSSLILP
jgi:hypothetical protein